MKLPKTADDIEKEILLSSDKSKELGDFRIRQLISILNKVDSEIVVEGVIRIFENSRQETNFQDQEFAGKVLESIHPRSQKDIKEVLLRTLKNWDKSVEQFPFWLRDNYGLEDLKKAINGLQLTDQERDKLNTIKWWLNLDIASA